MRNANRFGAWLKRRNNQKGFTLIELLVVISILGILAAIVTMSMVGITKVATDRAAAAEAQSVQIAYDTMLADQGVAAGDACPAAVAGGPAKGSVAGFANMQSFPTSSAWEDQTVYSSTVHAPKQLYPRYLRNDTTHGRYHCVAGQPGLLVQDSYTP